MSLKNKIKTINKSGFKPVLAGIKNKVTSNTKTEELAKERANTCIECDYFEDEPVNMLKVSDSKIPDLNGKMCGDCWCALPLKVRQSVEICKRWKR